MEEAELAEDPSTSSGVVIIDSLKSMRKKASCSSNIDVYRFTVDNS